MPQKRLSPIQLNHLKRQVSKEETILKVASDFFRTYEEFCEELIELYDKIGNLRGPAGRPFLYSDFTAAQLKMLKGRPGKDAPDYEKIVEMVLEKTGIPQDGKSPIKGKDYFTAKEIEEITAASAKMVLAKTSNKPSREVIDNICTIIEERVSKKQFRIEDILGLEERLKDIMRRGGGEKGYMHGGGDTVSAGTNVTITRNLNGDKVINAGGGSGIAFETPAGTVNDSNITFNVSNEPEYIVVNGAQYFVGTGAYASYLAGVITLAYPVGTGGFIRSAYST